VLGLESLEVRCIRSDCITLYKMHSGLLNVNFNDFFVFRSNVILRPLPRLNLLSLNIPRFHCNARMYSFAVRSASYWNSLHDDIVTANTLNSFARTLPNNTLVNFVRGRALQNQ